MTSLEHAKQFAPGSRAVTIRYGRTPSYRDPNRKSWGFWISDESATDVWYSRHTCPRRSARSLFEHLDKNARDRGFVVTLVVDDGCGLDADLAPVGQAVPAGLAK